MTWLITGGAGYIGGHIVDLLVREGRPVVVLDDLSTGDRSRLHPNVPLVDGSVGDEALVREALVEHRIEGVLHLAAKKSVPESVEQPLAYYASNVDGTRSLLSAMQATGVRRMVFSSSAAVYGTPSDELVAEDFPTLPESPYAETKLIGEWLVRDCAVAWGLAGVSLRYFNVAGARSPQLADRGATNLVPLVIKAILAGRPPQVFGGDWPSPDGTCIRDYIHVEDLAEAHLVAIDRTAQLSGAVETYNVGGGRGASVLEVIRALADVSGETVEPEIVGRRPGDPFRVVADPTAIRRALGWQASRDLSDIVKSAWESRSTSAS